MISLKSILLVRLPVVVGLLTTAVTAGVADVADENLELFSFCFFGSSALRFGAAFLSFDSTVEFTEGVDGNFDLPKNDASVACLHLGSAAGGGGGSCVGVIFLCWFFSVEVAFDADLAHSSVALDWMGASKGLSSSRTSTSITSLDGIAKQS